MIWDNVRLITTKPSIDYYRLPSTLVLAITVVVVKKKRYSY